MNETGKKIRLGDLSGEARNAVRDQCVSGRYDMKGLLGILDEVALFEISRWNPAKLKRIVNVVLVTAILPPIILFFFEQMVYAAFLVVPCLALCGSMILWARKRSTETCFTRDLQEVVLPFLRTVAADIDPKGKVTLRLDLAGITSEKTTRKGPLAYPPYRKAVETVYIDRWLHLNAPLAQGGALIVTIENHYTHRHLVKVNSRGKRKSKDKWKRRVIVSAGLIVDNTRFDLDARKVNAVADQVKLRVTEKASGKLIRMKRKMGANLQRVDGSLFYAKRYCPCDASMSHDELVGMFMKLASLLQPISRRG